MADIDPRPRLHGQRARLTFWAASCALTFVLAFGLGTVWSGLQP